jgi:hypothetical protein
MAESPFDTLMQVSMGYTLPRTLHVVAELGIADASPCCMDRRCGRIEPDPCSGLCNADVLRASELQHSVQHVGGDRHLGRLTSVRLEAQPVTDDTFPS